MNDPDIMLNYLETLLKESNFTQGRRKPLHLPALPDPADQTGGEETGDHHHQPGQGSLYPD